MSKAIIKFTNQLGSDYPIDLPAPASKFVPDWYKNTQSYIGDAKKPTGQGGTSATIKRCMPVFDAITAGYIITSPVDVYVSQKEGAPYYEWSALDTIAFHPIEQAPEHPNKNGFAYPKWNNPWAIQTPKGYSVLFMQPVHRESVFQILEGVVDTDQYTAAVNFPFVLTDPTFEGLIPAGTPIAQVIPFKRESWTMELGTEKEYKQQVKVTQKLKTKFFDAYKTFFWQRKEYK
jgi:hypothetical protein